MNLLDWQDISGGNGLEFRAEVPGGWLVKVIENVVHDKERAGMTGGWDWRVAITFVPDPEHMWQGITKL